MHQGAPTGAPRQSAPAPMSWQQEDFQSEGPSSMNCSESLGGGEKGYEPSPQPFHLQHAMSTRVFKGEVGWQEGREGPGLCVCGSTGRW